MSPASSSRESLFVRNIIFGVEDSLVSTVGLLAGIASSNIAPTKLLAIGAVYLFVEAFSMAAGSYLSEHSTEEFETGQRVQDNAPIIGALVMFVSFIVAGIIPITPYLLFPIAGGISASVTVSLIVLGIVGFIQARVSKVKPLGSVVRMIVIGGVAIVLGMLVGKVFGVS